MPASNIATMNRRRTALTVFTLTVLLSGCGGSTERKPAAPPEASGAARSGDDRRADDKGGVTLAGGSAGPVRDACALTEPQIVASEFEARPGTAEEPGPFPGTCSYELADGVSPQVIVADLGPAWTWRRLRSFYVQTRGTLRGVHGLGEAAFTAADSRSVEIVVRMKRRMYTVVAALGRDRGAAALPAERLARRIGRDFPARVPLVRDARGSR